jgi:hypothetical protein
MFWWIVGAAVVAVIVVPVLRPRRAKTDDRNIGRAVNIMRGKVGPYD